MSADQIRVLLQIIQMFLIYGIFEAAIPALVFGPALKKYRFTVRVMAYYCIGCLFTINYSLLITGIKLGCRFTLWLGTILFYLFAYFKVRKLSFRHEINRLYNFANKLAIGSLKWKTYLYQTKEGRKEAVRRSGEFFREIILKHLIEIIFVAAAIILCVCKIGSTNLSSFGFHKSDIPVHYNWVNMIYANKPFQIDPSTGSGGIYPLGMHLTIYYFTCMFDIIPVVWMCNFGLINLAFCVLGVICTAKEVCRNRFIAPIAGLMVTGFTYSSYSLILSRFEAALPMEYAFVFVFPAIIFAMEFFRIQRQEELSGRNEKKAYKKKQRPDSNAVTEKASASHKQEKKNRLAVGLAKCIYKINNFKQNISKIEVRDIPEYIKTGIKKLLHALRQKETYVKLYHGLMKILARIAVWIYIRALKIRDNWTNAKTMMLFFAFAFGLQTSIHFYATIVSVLFFVGMALAYAFMFFKPIYFRRIMGGVFGGLLIAVVPMAIAYIAGIPLQYSLYWAMDIIKQMTSMNSVRQTITAFAGKLLDMTSINAYAAGIGSRMLHFIDHTSSAMNSLPIMQVGFVNRAFSSIDSFIKGCIIAYNCSYADAIITVFWIAAFVCVILGLLFHIRHRQYGCRLLAVSFGTVTVLMSANAVILPAVMENYRYAEFIYFIAMIVFAAALDAVISLLSGWMSHFKYTKFIPHVISLICVAAFVYAGTKYGYIDTTVELQQDVYANEKNGEIITTENIVGDYKKDSSKTFTIVSTTDDLHMIDKYGYHYEINTLLHKLMTVGYLGTDDTNFDLYNTDADDLYDPNIYIPTDNVYIYVEKNVNLDLNTHDVQHISQKSASGMLPEGNAINVYQGENRLIEMSKMYQWVQALQKRYPDSVTVYYEDQDFVCYKLEQSKVPYNLGLDYGYNYSGEDYLIYYNEDNDTVLYSFDGKIRVGSMDEYTKAAEKYYSDNAEDQQDSSDETQD